MKSLYKHIIFDLDGTLSDSRAGIYNAYFHVFDKLGLTNPGPEALKTLIGPPLQKGFSTQFGLEGEANANAVKVFREYYSTKGLFENTLYEGIKELLHQLTLAGATLYVATAKYQLFADQVINHFGIAPYFKDISGADYKGDHASKTDLVAVILRRHGIQDPAEVVLIGDTRYDIEAAAELEIDSIAVTYGFTTPEEIAEFNPDYIVNQVKELEELLLAGR
jgi:phosphoglycolate phosphatase